MEMSARPAGRDADTESALARLQNNSCAGTDFRAAQTDLRRNAQAIRRHRMASTHVEARVGIQKKNPRRRRRGFA